MARHCPTSRASPTNSMIGSAPVDQRFSCRCRSSLSVAVLELALGVEALDAGVGVGLLFGVDPGGRQPFGQVVEIHPAGPAFLEEVGVVVTAEQGEVLQV